VSSTSTGGVPAAGGPGGAYGEEVGGVGGDIKVAGGSGGGCSMGGLRIQVFGVGQSRQAGDAAGTRCARQAVRSPTAVG